jgi:hypothetical protein
VWQSALLVSEAVTPSRRFGVACAQGPIASRRRRSWVVSPDGSLLLPATIAGSSLPKRGGHPVRTKTHVRRTLRTDLPSRPIRHEHTRRRARTLQTFSQRFLALSGRRTKDMPAQSANTSQGLVGPAVGGDNRASSTPLSGLSEALARYRDWLLKCIHTDLRRLPRRNRR